MTALEFHPLSDLFPLLEGVEFDALVADIKANGLQDDITLHDGMILDGRNRYRACLAVGWSQAEIWERCFTYPYSIDPLAHVISANIHRRHLTPEQKREIIAKLIKAQPEKPDLQIAKTAKASPTTVGKVRAEMEATGDVSTVETRTDTRGRKQPAKKSPKGDVSNLDTRTDTRGRKQQPAPKPVKHDERIISPELGERVGHLAYRLIQLDRKLARELADLILRRGVAERLWADLDTGINIEERAL